MDAIKFIEEYKRMCSSYNACEKEGCPIVNITEVDCREEMFQLVDKFVPVVEKWSEEHPQKTLKDDLLEKFPNTELRDDMPIVCACEIYGFPKRHNCMHDCRDCWNQPLNEMKMH